MDAQFPFEVRHTYVRGCYMHTEKQIHVKVYTHVQHTHTYTHVHTPFAVGRASNGRQGEARGVSEFCETGWSVAAEPVVVETRFAVAFPLRPGTIHETPLRSNRDSLSSRLELADRLACDKTLCQKKKKKETKYINEKKKEIKIGG